MTTFQIRQTGAAKWAVMKRNPDYDRNDPALCGEYLILGEYPDPWCAQKIIDRADTRH